MGAEQSQAIDEQDDTILGVVQRNSVSFLINSTKYVVSSDSDPEIGPEYLLIDFIRDKAVPAGTKYLCREGGCGAYLVVVTTRHPVTGSWITRSINSCLMPLLTCDGWDIKTVEHVGSTRPGSQLHPIQRRMVDLSSTQCVVIVPAAESSSSAYCPPSYADRVLPNGEILEGRWREEELPNLPIASSTTTAEAENVRVIFASSSTMQGQYHFNTPMQD